jgi:hypothetical protein
MEPLPPGEPHVHPLHDCLARACPRAGLRPDPWADQRDVGRPVVADFLGRDVELDDASAQRPKAVMASDPLIVLERKNAKAAMRP